ncbi:MAG: protoporphyrinogen oxidase, partial [Gemmataceae bacterium]|nr:protoporphyrinogen oxidase [Gemmataceae bacterium]
MPRIVIVGAGISGLAAAHRLQELRPEAEVVVLDAASRPGGKVLTLQRDGWTVEGGPNGFLDNSPAVMGLARAAGAGPLLVPASEAAGKNRFLLLDGRLQRLPSSLLSFLGSPLLSPMGKLDLLMERFRPRRASLKEESIDCLARRRGGREVARTLADAFVTGILAGDPKLLSAQASFPRLAAYERDHGSLSAGFAQARRGRPAGERQRMWSFAGGMGTLVDAVAARLRTPP